MNKFGIVLAIAAAFIAALIFSGSVSAQGTTPTDPQPPVYGYGNRGALRNNNGPVMAGRGVRAAGNRTGAVGEGILHDAMMTVYAQELGISVEALNARLAGGETLGQIAFEKGLTSEQFSTLMADARSQAVAQAVQAGSLTQEQADWMQQRGAGRSRGMRAGGAGSPDCPYYPQTTP
jgi:hypothetical protein